MKKTYFNKYDQVNKRRREYEMLEIKKIYFEEKGMMEV